MNKVLTICSVLLGLVFLAGCGQQQISQTQPTTPATVTQTSGQPVATQPAPTTPTLATYTNAKYGIEFQYPKTWTFDESASRFNPNSPKNCGRNIDSTIKEPTCLDGIFFTIEQNKEKLPLNKIFENNGWKNGQDYKDIREFKIGNVVAHKVTLISAYDGMSTEALYVPLSDGSFFVLQESYLVDDEKIVFDQMVSTFKFTK